VVVGRLYTSFPCEESGDEGTGKESKSKSRGQGKGEKVGVAGKVKSVFVWLTRSSVRGLTDGTGRPRVVLEVASRSSSILD
jgi:hypothetical protein